MKRSVEGFSLVEVLIASAVAIGLLAVVTQLFFQNSRSNQSAALSAEFNALAANVGMILNYPSSCQAVLAGKVFNPASLPASANPLNLGTGVVAQLGPLGGLQLTKLELDRMMHDLGVQPSTRHGYLANLHLEAVKPAAGGALPGGSVPLSANFTVAIFVDPATKLIVKCSEP